MPSAKNSPANKKPIDLSTEEQKAKDAIQKDLTRRHSTNLDEALAGQEADGGESVLGGAPREGEAEHVDRVSEEEHKNAD